MNQMRMMKRITAWILVICMVLLNSPLTGIKAKAETTVFKYTIKAQVVLGTGEQAKAYNIPGGYIAGVYKKVMVDEKEEKIEIKGEGNVFELEPEKSYICKIKGNEISEHEVTFTTPKPAEGATAGTVMISADKTKIITTGGPVTVNKNDEISYRDDLEIDWKLATDSKEEHVRIDNNKIKGIKKGTGTVTCTAEKDSDVKRTITVNVTEEGAFSLSYIVGNDVWDDVDNSGITITHSTDSSVITPNSDGKYVLQWGEKYKYSVKNKVGFLDKEETEFVVPEQAQGSISIALSPVKPKLMLEGKNILDSGTEIKKGEDAISVSCDNYNQLHHPEKWSMRVNGAIGDSQQSGEALKESNNIISTSDASPRVQILYDGKEVGTKSLVTFEDYTLMYTLAGTTLSPVVTYEDENKTETSVERLKAGKTYNVKNVTVTGIDNYICSGNEVITPKYTEENISVTLDGTVTLTEPIIKIEGLENNNGVYEGLYGTDVTIEVENKDSLLKGGNTGWAWSCKNDSGNEMTVKNGKLVFEGGSKQGIYPETFFWNIE